MATVKCLKCMGDYDDTQAQFCPHCGSPKKVEKKEPYHIDPGFILKNRYLIGRSIGSGGFGVTYVAWDSVLNKRVAIKEYFPSELATRIQGTTEVCAYDGEKTYQFKAGLQSFVEEAMRLSKLNKLPHIVHILDSFVDNCTAYIIMEYVEGATLEEMLKSRGPLPYDEVVGYVVPVLNALQKVHDEGIIHRDIAPDNIKVFGDEVTLIDFGAARNATTHNSKSLSVIVKPGYAPEEQYRSRGVQGPWTDVYAMAAVMYHLITGKRPMDSMQRCIKDELKTPTELGFPIPEGVENAIMNALNVKAEYRFQTATEFAEALEGFVPRVVPKSNDEPVRLSKRAKIIISAVAVVVVAIIIAIIAKSFDVNFASNHSGDMLPNFVSVEKDEAFAQMDEAGIQYQVDGTSQELQGVAEDTEVIAWQSVEPETPLEDVDVLSIKIAKAPIKRGEIPDLSAQTKDGAIKALKEAGFTNYSFETKETDKYKEGLVCDQSVKKGKKVAVDTKIVVYLAKNKPTTTRKQTTTKKRVQTTRKSSNEDEWSFDAEE